MMSAAQHVEAALEYQRQAGEEWWDGAVEYAKFLQTRAQVHATLANAIANGALAGVGKTTRRLTEPKQ